MSLFTNWGVIVADRLKRLDAALRRIFSGAFVAIRAGIGAALLGAVAGVPLLARGGRLTVAVYVGVAAGWLAFLLACARGLRRRS